MLKELKELINTTIATVYYQRSNIEAWCALVWLDISISYSEPKLVEELKKAVTDSLAIGDGERFISFEEIKQIENALVYETVMDGADNTYCIAIIEILRSATKWPVLSEVDKWRQSIQRAKNYFLFTQQSPLDHSTLRQYRAKAFDTATAAKYLVSKGYDIFIDDIKLNYSQAEELITTDLNGKVKRLGGLTLIGGLAENLIKNKYYLAELKRYAVSVRVSGLPDESRPMIPFGYLFNIAVKFPTEYPKLDKNRKQADALLREIVALAINYCSLYNTQVYGQYEGLFRYQQKLGVWLQEIAIFDTIYTLPSCDWKDSIEITEHLFSWIDESKMLSEVGFTLAEFMAVAKWICQLAPENGASIIYLSVLKKHFPEIPKSKLLSILTSMSIPATAVNADFQLPNDAHKQNLLFKPLIAISQTMYCLPDLSWSVPAFYEVIADIARKKVETIEREADKQIGLAHEEFIKEKLKEKKILFACGLYKKDTAEQGECDLIIETEKAIIIIEVKKKGLTRIARSGQDAEIIADLGDSLLDAQIQTGKVELLLYKDGFVELEDAGGQQHRIERNGRLIERIAVTLQDFGGYQDRMFLSKLLEQMVDVKIHLQGDHDPIIVRKINKLNKKLPQWTQQAIELRQLNPGHESALYYDCWFISLPQLLVILKYSTDKESFYQTLCSIKSISLGSSNFYFEFYHTFINKLMPEPNFLMMSLRPEPTAE